jgi:hypothetical protein
MPVIPGENEADFQAYAQGWLGELKPAGPAEEFLAERIISVAWRLRRAGKIETECFKSDVLDTQVLARLNRYENALERSFYRNLKELRDLQAARAAQPESEPEPNVSGDRPAPMVIQKFSWVFAPATLPSTSPGFSESPQPAPPRADA